jgi:hypothetical protein
MRKFTLLLSSIFLFVGGILYAQIISTGVVDLSSTPGLEMTAKIDVSSTDVTLKITGPDDRWLGVSLNGTTMISSADVVIYDGSNLTDRVFNNAQNRPSEDTQDWSITSNTTLSGLRTIVATRSLSGSDATDHVFSNTDTSINLLWARGNSTFNLTYHGGGNRGAVSNVSYGTLSADDFSLANFTLYPNPSEGMLTVGLPQGFLNAEVNIHNYLGKKVIGNRISRLQNHIDTRNLSSGMYILKLNSEGKSYSKKFIVK